MSGPSLTPEQIAAVELGDGAHLLTAPPGSGKTEVLVRRVMHLLQSTPGETFRLLALTYTVRAAQEIRSRVAEVVPTHDQWRVTAGTFHAFCLEVLENYGDAVGIKRPVTVYEEDEDKKAILVPLLESASETASADDAEWAELFRSIARCKTDLVPPQTAPTTPVLDGTLTFAELYDIYETALLNAGGIDFEGMLFRAVELLQTDSWVAQHYRRIYRHILVDEGQEMNQAQYEFIRSIMGRELPNVFIVADIDQSINTFAGGGPRFLTQYLEEFGATQHSLTTNFRSAQGIVDAARRLRSHITHRQSGDWKMTAATLAPGWVRAVSLPDELEEAAYVAAWIENLLNAGLDTAWLHEGEESTLAPEDVCIQGRTRYAFDHVVEALHEKRIPVVVRTDEGGLFDSSLGRLTLYSLRLALNPRDIPTRRRLIAELPEDSIKEIGPSPESVASALRGLAVAGLVTQEWAELLSRTASNGVGESEVVSALLSIQPDFTSENEALSWSADQEALERCWIEYQASTRATERSLQGFMKVLYQLQRSVRDEPGIRVLTPHRARGLGFKTVVVLGLNEGTFPHYRAATVAEIDEERRALYVAASRAARVLLLTRPRSRRTRRGFLASQQESRFLSEMAVPVQEQ